METFLTCPHCGVAIQVVEENCKIFRCGVYKATMEQINPHLPKVECDAITDLIYGCGKPFCLVDNELRICDYV